MRNSKGVLFEKNNKWFAQYFILGHQTWLFIHLMEKQLPRLRGIPLAVKLVTEIGHQEPHLFIIS